MTRDAYVLVVTSVSPTAARPYRGIFVIRQVESIRRLGVRCEVMFIRRDQSRLAYPNAAGRLALASTFGRERPALVHAHGGEAALAALFAWREPLLVSFSGSDILGVHDERGDVAPRWRARRGVIRHVARYANATITKSQAMELALPSSSRGRNHVIPNGIDRELFRPMDRTAARRQLGWDAEERVALFAASPEVSMKRHRLAEKACARASERLGPVRLAVVDGVPPDDVPLFMNAGDCLIHPSASEGSPNVVKEALACNLPVIATPVGDVPQLLAGVENSYVCPPAVEPLADALRRCLDPPRRSNGRERTLDLDEARIATRIAGIYADLTDGVLASDPAR